MRLPNELPTRTARFRAWRGAGERAWFGENLVVCSCRLGYGHTRGPHNVTRPCTAVQCHNGTIMGAPLPPPTPHRWCASQSRSYRVTYTTAHSLPHQATTALSCVDAHPRRNQRSLHRINTPCSGIHTSISLVKKDGISKLNSKNQFQRY